MRGLPFLVHSFFSLAEFDSALNNFKVKFMYSVHFIFFSGRENPVKTWEDIKRQGRGAL